MRIGDAAPQHLIAAAKPKHMSAAPHMRGNVDVPATCARSVSKIGDGRFRARHNDEIADRQWRAALDHDQFDVWLRGERIEIVEIGDMRQERHRHSDLAVARMSAAAPTRS